MTRLPARKVVVFGEDLTDQKALGHLVRALCPEASLAVRPIRKPLVLQKGREQAAARKNAQNGASAVRAEAVNGPIALVVAHQDCDAVAPAHEALIAAIEKHWGGALPGIPVVAAAPAFELEAWWLLWPEAVAQVMKAWRRLPAKIGDTGRIDDAKEYLIRTLRPTVSGKRPRDYAESDGPVIAEHVRTLHLVDALAGTNASFAHFRDGVRRVLCPRPAEAGRKAA